MGTYILASIPGWVVAVLVAVALHRLADLPAWGGAVMVLAWIGTDLARFPRVRRYYTGQPEWQRITAETATSVSALSPRGFVRVRGELWQARSADPRVTIPKGARVQVCDVQGLELVVEPLAPARPDGSPSRSSSG